MATTKAAAAATGAGSTSHHPKTGAISKGYNFASTWEQNAPLTEQQQAAIVALSHAFAERPFPVKLSQEHVGGQDNGLSISTKHSTMEETGAIEAVLVNTNQFYKWFTDLEAAMKSETEEKYQHYLTSLTERIETCDGILHQVEYLCRYFNMHLIEKQKLIEFAEALRTKLNYFDELENVRFSSYGTYEIHFHVNPTFVEATSLNLKFLAFSPKQGWHDKRPLDILGFHFSKEYKVATNFYSANVASGNFLALLKRLDECISYVESNPQYAESSVYLVKFRQLQSRALGMIRSHVLSVLKSASSQVQAAIRSSSDSNMAVSEGVEASVIYVRFKAAASELKPVLEEIERRSPRKEYVQILAECHKLYCEQRLSLVKGIVHRRISEFSKKDKLPSLTRSGCAYLMQVCQLEHQLFDHFFPSSAEDISSLAPLIDPLCMYLYDTLRPKLIHEVNLDILCELVNILKVEVLGEKLNIRSESLAGLRPTLDRILEDVQERLTFRARNHIRDEVGIAPALELGMALNFGYLVLAAINHLEIDKRIIISKYFPLDEDLDYPAKLEQLPEMKREATSADENSDVFKTWYPPLEKTLSCLSKLYRCLEPAVFTGLAQEALEVCTMSIQKASKLIAKRSSPMDGQLFLIKHLLILREQIGPFDIEFSVTHKELDFSHLLDHLRRILRGQASLFDWSRSTSLARTLSPRVLESQIDAKKELEKSLKVTCEEFIMSVTKLVVDPMLSFVTKVTAVKVALSSGSPNQKMESPMTKPLKDQAFATPDKVAQLVQKVSDAIQQELPRVMAKMKLYLQNQSTRTILFKPIR
ncbi:hypothetical protein C3L33_10336, partial [Rhododendron williamsianum]